MAKQKPTSTRLFYGILLIALAVLIYLPVVNVKLYVHSKQEFKSHAQFAQTFVEDLNQVPKFIIAHPLYMLAEVAVMKIIAVDARKSGLIVSVLAYIWLAWIIYKEFLKRLQNTSNRPELKSLALTLVSLIVAHIPVLLFVDRDIYFGYIGINVYHNATSNFLKPFALIGFLYSLKAFQSTFPTAKETLITATLLVLATLVKPNFIICLLPALAIYLFLCWKQKQTMHWRFILAGIFIPSALTLAWQFFYNYTDNSSRIIFYPLGVKAYYSDELILKFISSILFPLLVTRIYIRDAAKDSKVVLAWLSFLFGAFYAYFLAENSGGAFTHGNFDWSAEITLFILFVVNLLFFLEKKLEKPRIAFGDGVIVAALTAHVLSGILYYIYSLTIDNYSELTSLRRMFEAFFRIFTQ
ncbi:MAG: hypothetical protein WHV66_05365 [Anaerolineales bacterium]